MWQDLYRSRHGHLDLAQAEHAPFSLRFDFSGFGTVGLGQFDGSFNRIIRSAERIAAKPSDTFCIVLNRGRARLTYLHRSREEHLPPGGLALFCDHETSELRGPEFNRLAFVPVDRDLLLPMVRDIDDLAGRPLDSRHPAVRHLARYMDLLADDFGVPYDQPLAEHIDSALLSLIALALGGNKDAEECARLGGVRAARLKSVLVEIQSGFLDPAFSVHRIAAVLGLSPRYVQDLLHANGPSFSVRVLEHRLQTARKMLIDPDHDRMRVSDISFACGFNEVSYFNRCYRKRFGATPLDHRHGRPASADDIAGQHRPSSASGGFLPGAKRPTRP